MQTELNALAEEIHRTSVDRGWWSHGSERPLDGLLMLVVCEVAEAMEEWRSNHEPSEVYFKELKAGGGVKPEGVPIELADVIIRVLDVCAAYGIDIDAAMETKMAFNKTRPMRHGGKRT